jgi:hypothetical protein
MRNKKVKEKSKTKNLSFFDLLEQRLNVIAEEIRNEYSNIRVNCIEEDKFCREVITIVHEFYNNVVVDLE